MDVLGTLTLLILMDFIQNEINYNLIILYIEDFIQYELELEKGLYMAKDKISGLVNNIKELYIKNDYKIFKDEILNISTDYSPLPLEYRQGFMIFDTKNCNNDYKHRYYAYYDLRMSKKEDEKLLTFILFNPSFANVSYLIVYG